MPRTEVAISELTADSVDLARVQIDTVNGHVISAPRGIVVWMQNTQASPQTVRVTSTQKGETFQKDFTLAALTAYLWENPDLDFWTRHGGGADEGKLYFDQVGGSSNYTQIAAFRPRRR